MLAEVGAKFSLQGIEAAMSKLRGLSGEFSGLNRSVGSEVSQFHQKTQMMAQSVDKLATQIKRSMSMAKTAMLGMATGRIVQGIVGGAPTGPGTGHAEDFNRMHGATPGQLDTVREQARTLGRKLPFFNDTDYGKALYSINPLFQKFGDKALADAHLKMGYLSKVMDKSVTEAAAYYTNFHSMFAGQLSPEEQLKFPDKILSVQLAAQRAGTALPEDIEHFVVKVGSLFSAAGKTVEETVAEAAVLAKAAGGGAQAGTAIKAIAGKSGEIYAKLRDEVQRSHFAREQGMPFWQLPEEKQKEFQLGQKPFIERESGVGEELFVRNTDNYYLKINAMMEELKRHVPNWMGRLGETIDTRAIPAFMSRALMAKTGDAKRIRGEIADGVQNSAQTPSQIEGSFQSFESKYNIFSQKVGQLQGVVARTKNSLVEGLLETWGNSLTNLTDLWIKFSGGILANANAFFGSMKAGFLSSLGWSPDLEETATNFIRKLGGTDPDSEGKWKDFGQRIGTIAGTSFGPLVDSLREIGSALTTIASVINTVTVPFRYLADLASGDSWVKKIASNDWAQILRLKDKLSGPDATPAGLVSRRRAGGGSAAADFFGAGQVPEWHYVGMHNRMAEAAMARPTPLLERVAEPAGPVMPSPAASAGAGAYAMQTPEEQARNAFPVPPINVEAPQVQSQVQVFLDGSEIAAQVRERISSDAARNRQGAGDGFLSGF